MDDLRDEIAAHAARLVVEDGLEYGQAKQRAARDLGLSPRQAQWPDNLAVEQAVREYLALFCADSQPAELALLRGVARRWMQRLAPLRPHLCGAVWRGTATRHSALRLELYTDDPKSAELELLNQGLDFEVGSTRGPRGETVDVLMLDDRCPELGSGLAGRVSLHLTVLDHDDLRGALKPDASGQTWRGDLAALERRMADAAS